MKHPVQVKPLSQRPAVGAWEDYLGLADIVAPGVGTLAQDSYEAGEGAANSSLMPDQISNTITSSSTPASTYAPKPGDYATTLDTSADTDPYTAAAAPAIHAAKAAMGVAAAHATPINSPAAAPIPANALGQGQAANAAKGVTPVAVKHSATPSAASTSTSSSGIWSRFPIWGKIAVGVGLVAGVATLAVGGKK